MLAEAGFTDFDLAVADAALAYGRLQVGNRSRRQTDEFEAFLKGVSDRGDGDGGEVEIGTEREIMLEMRKLEVEWSASASHTDEDSEADDDDDQRRLSASDGDDDERGDDAFDEPVDDGTASTASVPSSSDGGAVSLQTKATATRAVRSRLLSRKMRRGPHALVDALVERRRAERPRGWVGAAVVELAAPAREAGAVHWRVWRAIARILAPALCAGRLWSARDAARRARVPRVGVERVQDAHRQLLAQASRV